MTGHPKEKANNKKYVGINPTSTSLLKSIFEGAQVYLQNESESSMVKGGLKPTLEEGCSLSGAQILGHGNPQAQGSSDKSCKHLFLETSTALREEALR